MNEVHAGSVGDFADGARRIVEAGDLEIGVLRHVVVRGEDVFVRA